MISLIFIGNIAFFDTIHFDPAILYHLYHYKLSILFGGVGSKSFVLMRAHVI